MKLGNLEIMGDLVLAPMAGVTDLAFRTICAELGAAVTVTAAGEREVTVAAQVSLTGGAGAGAVQDAFRAALAGYLHTLIEGKYGAVYYKPADDQPYTLLYNRVLALLLNVEGVENFASLTVNGGTADVTIQAGEIPVLGEVSVT